jgi:DNA primase
LLTLEFVTDYVLSNFEGVKITKNGTHFLARCRICGDSAKSKSKKRFNLDWNNGRPIWHCFNCSESGSFLDLYSQLEGISRGHAYKILFEYDTSQYDGDSIREKYAIERSEEIKENPEPFVFQDILSDCLGPKDKAGSYITQKFQNYLLYFYKFRNIPEDVKLFVAYKGDYKGRVIIPIYDVNNNLVYFQGRAISENMEPKYKNPELPKAVIYNEAYFERDKYIIVTEGLLDAFTIPRQGTTCLGGSVSDEFVKKLTKYTDKGIILVYDNDKPGVKSLLKFMKESKFANSVFYFLFPDKYQQVKDLNEFVGKMAIRETNLYPFIVDHKLSRVAAETKLRLIRRNLL